MSFGFKDVKEFQQILVTPEFKTIYVPYLNGTQKQIEWAEQIRKLYVETLQRKLSAIPIFNQNERLDMISKFNNYVNADIVKNASFWINHHCSKCGSFMDARDGRMYCPDHMCGYSKLDSEYQG